MKKQSIFKSLFGLLLCLSIATAMFNSCGDENFEELAPEIDPATISNDINGIVINGVRWATRNVAASGTFAARPEALGMFYQWNRKTAWPATGSVTGWDSSTPTGTDWEKANDPSPAGWRVPTFEELEKLIDTNKVSSVWVSLNGVNGRKFTDNSTGNSIFLPAAGYRSGSNGTLNYVGSNGLYWSSTQYDGSGAYRLNFNSGNVNWYYWNYRRIGLSVRAVED